MERPVEATGIASRFALQVALCIDDLCLLVFVFDLDFLLALEFAPEGRLCRSAIGAFLLCLGRFRSVPAQTGRLRCVAATSV